MKKRFCAILALLLCICMLTGCSKEPKADELPTLRKLSWEGTELTVTVGTNKTTGCEWHASCEDYSIVDFSINRVFHLVISEKEEAVGYSEIGFEGKGAGTSTVTLTTPCDWDGSGNGYKYIITVTVNEDGTIASAEGREEPNTPAPVETPAEPTEETADPASYAATYTYLGIYQDGYVVMTEGKDDWTTTLNADGSGSIDWGEDAKGSIRGWEPDGDDVALQIGDSTLNGTVRDGIMVLLVNESYHVWAAPDADMSGVRQVTEDEYNVIKTDAVRKDAPGSYYPFAMGRGDGYLVAYPERTEDGMIVISEDGTGTLLTGTVTNSFKWDVDDNALTISDPYGTDRTMAGSISEGVLLLVIEYENDGEMAEGISVYARDGADTSYIETVTPEEYKALIEAQD